MDELQGMRKEFMKQTLNLLTIRFNLRFLDLILHAQTQTKFICQWFQQNFQVKLVTILVDCIQHRKLLQVTNRY